MTQCFNVDARLVQLKGHYEVSSNTTRYIATITGIRLIFGNFRQGFIKYLVLDIGLSCGLKRFCSF